MMLTTVRNSGAVVHVRLEDWIVQPPSARTASRTARTLKQYMCREVICIRRKQVRGSSITRVRACMHTRHLTTRVTR